MNFNKVYIPTFISSIDYKPARVLPHLYFFNGMLQCDQYFIENEVGEPEQQSYFPYFDNYSGNLPTTESKSLLFFNEPSFYGTTPTNSLYSEYWSDYVELLYNPYTRTIQCSAIIPLADYFKMNLNDIVEWRGNMYHLRAINDYNLKNGECTLELLGPLLNGAYAGALPQSIKCEFDYSIQDADTLTRNITLLDAGPDSGPFYQVYESADGITYTLLTVISLPTIGSVASVTFNAAQVVCKLVNITSLCQNSVIHTIPGTLLGDFSLDFSQLDFN